MKRKEKMGTLINHLLPLCVSLASNSSVNFGQKLLSNGHNVKDCLAQLVTCGFKDQNSCKSSAGERNLCHMLCPL